MLPLKQWGLSKEHTMAIDMTLRYIEALSRQQKDLRLHVNETKDPVKARELQKQDNKVLHNIWRRAMNVAIEKLVSQAAEVE